MVDLVWEEPPPPRATNPENDATAEGLRERPGQWARVGAFPDSTMLAANIKRGRPKAFAPAGTFEAVSRKVGGESLLYARYVGAAGNSEAESDV